MSHVAGVGENTDPDDLQNYFPLEIIRAVLLVRINRFLRGHSGVRRCLIKTLIDMLQQGVVPLVPIQSAVVSSDDLCPLAHLFCPLLGQGRFYLMHEKDQLGFLRDGGELARSIGISVRFAGNNPDTGENFVLSYKEGLAPPMARHSPWQP